MSINMSVEDNFSSHIDPDTGLAVFVDTFDNKEFEVRIGTIDESKSVGTVSAENDEELSKKVAALIEEYKGQQ